eukprot:5337914-Alexandrium_andersonii.AAC.1
MGGQMRSVKTGRPNGGEMRRVCLICPRCRQRTKRRMRHRGRQRTKPVSYTHLTLPTICSV